MECFGPFKGIYLVRKNVSRQQKKHQENSGQHSERMRPQRSGRWVMCMDEAMMESARERGRRLMFTGGWGGEASKLLVK